MQGDLRSLDPIWTTANITAYHGAMIYDTLFALDEQMRPQPQMVGKWGLSDDKLTYTFELRDGLKFSDGAAVTADDVVASIRRWAARDGAGQHMMARVKDLSKKDDKTFVDRAEGALRPDPRPRWRRPRRRCSTSCARRKPRPTRTSRSPNISARARSPTIATRRSMGSRYVYDRNPNYVSRSEPATGMAGAKNVKVDRVIYENMPDSQTALQALKAGEIDFFEIPPIDLIDTLESDPEHQGRGAEQDRQLRHHAAQLPASAVQQGRGAPGACST